MKRGTTTDHELFSTFLNEDVPFIVYTPADFSPFTAYSFLICQDGADYFQIGRLPRIAEELMQENEIEPVILIGVPYQNKADRRRKYHPDGDQNDSYIRFLGEELVPYLDKTFPGHNQKDSRALAGDSLAGTVSFMTALRYPDLFGRVLMHSPYVDSTVIAAAEQADEFPALYHQIGLQETDVLMTNGERADFLTPNRSLAALLQKKAAHYEYGEFDGTHTWTYWQKDMQPALIKMFE